MAQAAFRGLVSDAAGRPRTPFPRRKGVRAVAVVDSPAQEGARDRLAGNRAPTSHAADGSQTQAAADAGGAIAPIATPAIPLLDVHLRTSHVAGSIYCFFFFTRGTGGWDPRGEDGRGEHANGRSGQGAPRNRFAADLSSSLTSASGARCRGS
jgi:hypothetical protein